MRAAAVPRLELWNIPAVTHLRGPGRPHAVARVWNLATRSFHACGWEADALTAPEPQEGRGSASPGV